MGLFTRASTGCLDAQNRIAPLLPEPEPPKRHLLISVSGALPTGLQAVKEDLPIVSPPLHDKRGLGVALGHERKREITWLG
ncbi:MAG: hypothetical protein HY329_01150 [Chloroflexi bacterium]|nr:hypothetical protein [Chloroflexota bacterium]